MAKSQSTCGACGKRFTSWRAKKFCSEPCRKKAENSRLRGSKSAFEGKIPDAENASTESLENRATPKALRGYGPPVWVACNEVTRKLTFGASPTAVGWAMLAEVSPGREVWFGRIGNDFSFGPTTQARAKAAVEARLLGHPFTKQDDERSWSETCWRLLGGSGDIDPRSAPLVLAA